MAAASTPPEGFKEAAAEQLALEDAKDALVVRSENAKGPQPWADEEGREGGEGRGHWNEGMWSPGTFMEVQEVLRAVLSQNAWLKRFRS